MLVPVEQKRPPTADQPHDIAVAGHLLKAQLLASACRLETHETLQGDIFRDPLRFIGQMEMLTSPGDQVE